MKILFISSGRNNEVSVVVKNQGESITKPELEIDYFLVKPGFFQYLFSIPKLRRKYKSGNYDLAHAHYSFSGFVAGLAGCRPLIVSLMGSDVFMSGFFRVMIYFFYHFIWDITIVKTEGMKSFLNFKKAFVLPNGVDVNRFKPFLKEEARYFLHYPQEKQIVLFISSPGRQEKNLSLALESFEKISNDKIEFKHIYNIANEDMPYYFNAADVFLLTSKWEGSVNVIKEAMACNCPIVSTDVGDIRWVTGNTEGCFITSFEPDDVARNLKYALNMRNRTRGRDRIFKLGLDSATISKNLTDLYKVMLAKRK